MPRHDLVTVFCCGTKSHRDRQGEAVADMYRWCDGRKGINDGPGAPGHAVPKIEHLFKEGKQPTWWQNVRGKTPYNVDRGHWGDLQGQLGGTGSQDNVLVTLTWLWEEYHHEPFTVCNLVGWSRGAVTCIAIANAMQHTEFAEHGVRVNIFAYDPVPGGLNDFDEHGTFDETGRAGIEHLPGMVKNYHSILMENVGGLKGLVFKCIAPQEAGQESHKNYALPGAHGDPVFWAKPNNPAGKLGLTLGLEFLLQHGTTFTEQAVEHFLTPDQKLEEYSKLRLAWLEKCGYREKSRGLAWARRGTVVNEWRHDSPFINQHHFDLFKLVLPELCQAMVTTKVVSRELVAQLDARLPATIALLNVDGLIRIPGFTHNDVEFDYVYDVEVKPTQQEIDNVYLPLLGLLAKAKSYRNGSATSSQVWTVDQWRKASGVLLGKRKEQVAEIDRLLPLYHEAGKRNKVGQFRLLFPLAEQIMSHLRQKGTDSDRHIEVAMLGRQVRVALEHPPASGV